MTRRQAYLILALAIAWLCFTVAAALIDAPVWLVAFFAFCSGEQWREFWHLLPPRRRR